MSERALYKVVFQSQGKVYEIFARQVSQGGMLGFVEVAELDMGRRTELVLDPVEERIRTEFQGVRRTWLPMHSIIRIDEVEKRGTARISDATGSNVAQFPISYVPQGNEPPKPK